MLDKNPAVVYIVSKFATNKLMPEVLRMDRKSIAQEYLELTSLWNDAKSDIIANNIEKHFKRKYPESSGFAAKLSEITGSSKHTVYAWFNKSRGNAKVPLVKLCMIAQDFNIDIMELLTEEQNEEVCN